MACDMSTTQLLQFLNNLNENSNARVFEDQMQDIYDRVVARRRVLEIQEPAPGGLFHPSHPAGLRSVTWDADSKDQTEFERNTLEYLLETLVRNLKEAGVYDPYDETRKDEVLFQIIDKAVLYLQKIKDDRLPF